MSQVAFIERVGMSQPYDKSTLKLDFDSRATASSRKRKILGVTSPALLQSPDLKLLKLGSPELEKIIINNNGFIPTPTPGGNSSFLQTGENSKDNENFVHGFIEALQKLQEQDVPITQGWDANIPNTSSLLSKTTSVISPPKWDQNRNTVGVTTPVITNRFDTQSPPIPKLQSSSTPVLVNFPTASTGAVSTMGLTALPRASTSYITRPQSSVLTHSSLSHQSSSHSMTTSGITLPVQGPLSNSVSPLGSVSIKSEDEAIVPSNASTVGDPTELDSNRFDPIDLESQEAIKHQRKKERNRQAAQRCRKRKIEREETLKVKVKDLKSKNSELTSLASTLRMQVCELKQQVMRHVNEGCQVFLKDNEEDKQLLTKTV